jgi:FKBP-type peptidyl-prolyl cis-trans isomerase FkpA
MSSSNQIQGKTGHNMRKLLAGITAVTMLSTLAHAAESLKTEEDRTLYAVGANMSRSLAVFTLTPKEFGVVLQGLQDTQSGKKPDFDITTYNSKIQELARTRRKALGDKQADAGKEYLAKAAKEKDAVKTPSGIVYIPVVEGKGESPKATDTVKVNYQGTLIDGREFDSTYKRGKPLEFRLDSVIKCWTEGLQKMKTGGKAKLVCPADMAYGDKGAGELILPGATLNFDVELLEVKRPPTPAPANKPAANPTPAKPAEKTSK